MNLLAGVDRFVKFPDVQDQMGRTAVEMENATVQIISAYVIQVRRVNQIQLNYVKNFEME